MPDDTPLRRLRLEGRCVNQEGVLVVRADAHMKFPRDRLTRPG